MAKVSSAGQDDVLLSILLHNRTLLNGRLASGGIFRIEYE
jgi:hypothetical protein